MLNTKKAFLANLNRENWLITTNDFNEPLLIHKKFDIQLKKEDIDAIKEYCLHISHIFECISDK